MNSELGHPSPPNLFRRLRATRRLAILGMGGEMGTNPVVGRTVEAGDALIDDVPAGFAAPIAPCAGTIAGVGWSQAIGGRAGKTILFDPLGAGVAERGPSFEESRAVPSPEPGRGRPGSPSSPTPPTTEPIPRDRDGLGAAIDRLRAGGVWADRWTCPDLLAQLH
jgi:hypothetical protein